MRDFSRSLSELHVIARNFDWFIVLSAPVVIGRSNYFGFGFSTVIWKPTLMWLMIISVNDNVMIIVSEWKCEKL